jgi:hypothetical protein
MNARTLGIALVAVLFSATAAKSLAVTIQWQTLDDPLAPNGTAAIGISGANIVGYYTDQSSHTHGFIYDGSTWTTIDEPLAHGTTYPLGVSGNRVVGYFNGSDGRDHGFLYDGTS